MKKFRGYIFSRSFRGERAPQSVQNIIIRDYCEKRSYEFLLSKSEYAIKDSYKILFYALKELKKIDGMVFYSVFMLPTDKSLRFKIYKMFLNNKKKLLFAVEDLQLKSITDIESIENILKIKKIVSNNLNNKISFFKK